jgi:hypothetical protein
MKADNGGRKGDELATALYPIAARRITIFESAGISRIETPLMCDIFRNGLIVRNLTIRSTLSFAYIHIRGHG